MSDNFQSHLATLLRHHSRTRFRGLPDHLNELRVDLVLADTTPELEQAAIEAAASLVPYFISALHSMNCELQGQRQNDTARPKFRLEVHDD